MLKWYKPKVHSGWRKEDAMDKRRRNALKAHKGNKLATARSLNALANVTKDEETKRKAMFDARHFYRLYKKGIKH